jgi:hypothetical protein
MRDWIIPWIDQAAASPTLYYHLPIGLACLLLFWVVLRSRSDWFFGACCFLVVVSAGWPFFGLQELNSDEAFNLIGALTLLKDPIYFRNVNGSTHGPLVEYLLAVPGLFGMSVNYASAHLVGFVVLTAVVFLSYLGLRQLFDHTPARLKWVRLAVLPLLFFFACLNYWDFVAVNAEYFALLALSILFCFICFSFRTRARYAWVGVATFLVPMAKLQACPIAVAMLASLFVSDFVFQRRPYKANLRNWAHFGAGLLGCVVLLWVYLLAFGLVDRFYKTFIEGNLLYANRGEIRSSTEKLVWSWNWLKDYARLEEFAPAQLLWWLGFLVASIACAKKLNGRSARILASLLGVVGASYLSFAVPGNGYQHYLLLLWAPLILASGVAMLAMIERLSYRGALAWAVTALFLFQNVLSPLRSSMAKENIVFAGRLHRAPIQGENAVKVISQYAKKGETMAMWGWKSRYFPMTGLSNALSYHPCTTYVQYALDYVVKICVEDLKKTTAPVFVDAVGEGDLGAIDRKIYGHEQFPEVRDHIQKNYQLVADVDGSRIYVENRRLETVSGAKKTAASPKPGFHLN